MRGLQSCGAGAPWKMAKRQNWGKMGKSNMWRSSTLLPFFPSFGVRPEFPLCTTPARLQCEYCLLRNNFQSNPKALKSASVLVTVTIMNSEKNTVGNANNPLIRIKGFSELQKSVSVTPKLGPKSLKYVTVNTELNQEI